MLKELHIENIAVIERADIEFSPGLVVLTGETGAGKSIVIDALEAVLGGRTSKDLVRAGADKAMVTALFESGVSAAWCAENGIDYEDGLILMRRVGADGKSVCRVNGVPVSGSQLRELGAMLLDIHGQNDGRALLDESRHLTYLDRFGVDEALRASYAEKYAEWRGALKEQSALKMDDEERERLTQSLTLSVGELEAARIRPGETAELASRRTLLRNSGKLTEALDLAYASLYSAERSAVLLCGEAVGEIERASRYSPELTETSQIVTDAMYALSDAAERLRDLRQNLDFSPEEQDALEARLDTLNRLQKKYACGETELLAKLDECKEKLGRIEYASDELTKLEKKTAQLYGELLSLASQLTSARKNAGERLGARVEAELKQLGMHSVSFAVEIIGKAKPDAAGADEVRFLMSANAGEPPGRISRVASGGELARIMLAMKNVFLESDDVETMVFDEIDTGVSGVAAQRVGEKLSELATSRQVLCVTHLPQIAAMADAHFLIEKAERGGRVYTSVTQLDYEGRKRELARLHGGENVTFTTLESAGEQLAASESFKRRIRKDKERK